MIFLPLKTSLVITNFLILAFLLFLIFDHFKASNNTRSWSVVFYVLSFGWLVLRGAFWCLTLTSTTQWGAFMFYMLYWVPVPMEFGSFMLIPSFFAHLLYPTEWRAYGSYARPIYILATSGLTIFTILWSVFSAVEQRQQQECAGDVNDDVTLSECFHTEYSGWVFRVLTLICFLFLAIIQAAYGVKLYYLHDWQILGRLSTSKELLTVVNILVSLSFVSRAIYQWIVMTFPQVHLPDVFLQNEKDVRLSIFIMVMAWDYIPTTLLLLTIVSRSSGTGFIMSMNHRLRGYSNPDDLVDSQSQHYHHYGHAEPLASQSSQDIKGEQPEDSICVRCFSTLVAFFSKQQVRNDEMAGDEQTRLVVSRRQPVDQKQPPLGKIPDDPFFHRYQMTTLPPPPNSWRVEAGLTPIPYQDEITPQRCWMNPPGGVDKDMCAASSLASHGRDSSSSFEEQRKVTPLDLRLTGDHRVSAIRWSAYAPFTSSPAREQIYCLPGSTTGMQHSSSGLLPSLASSPSSSVSYPERASSTSLRQPSYGSFNLPTREVGGVYTGRLSSQAQLQWYQQQTNDQINSNEMIVGSYHDSRPRQQPH